MAQNHRQPPCIPASPKGTSTMPPSPSEIARMRDHLKNGRFLVYECSDCQNLFSGDLPKSRFDEFLSRWNTIRCPRCNGQNLKTKGIAMS
jgi:DNA-directed RNA polymerase subunit RPC12/RpoP